MEYSLNFNFIESLKNRTRNEIFIWLCNIGAEKFWHSQTKVFKDKTHMRLVNHIEEINLLLCRKQDYMILRSMPDREYLKTAEKYGFEIPHILCPKNKDDDLSISELVLQDKQLINKLKNIKGNLVYFVPYVVTSFEEQIAKKCELSLIGANSEICRKMNDKIFNRRIAETLQFPVTEGYICESLDDILLNYSNLFLSNKGKPLKVVIKNPYNASGQGMYIAENEKQISTIVSLLKRTKASGSWILEKWYENKIDVNYQIFISPEGNVDLFSIKRQFVNGTVYIGSMISPRIKHDLFVKLNAYGEKIGKYLFSIGYTGIASIDSIIIEDRIIPIIEINARFTLSTYLSFLNDHFGKKNILFQYFDVAAEVPISYQNLLDLIEEEFVSQSNIFVFASSLLPDCDSERGGRYMGRVFVLFHENDSKIAKQNADRFKECIIKRLNGY